MLSSFNLAAKRNAEKKNEHSQLPRLASNLNGGVSSKNGKLENDTAPTADTIERGTEDIESKEPGWQDDTNSNVLQ